MLAQTTHLGFFFPLINGTGEFRTWYFFQLGEEGTFSVGTRVKTFMIDGSNSINY